MNGLRAFVGHPLRVNSWCRCPKHNIVVGGTPTSSHPKGYAVDLEALTEYMKYLIVLKAGELGFRGVGIGKKFIHLDDDPNKSYGRFWLY